MPQIREYSQQTAGPGVSNPTLISGSDISGGMGRNLQMLAEGVGQVNDYMAKEERQKQDFEAQKTKIQEQLDLNDHIQKLKMEAPAGADGFAEQAKMELDKRKQKLLDGAPSDYLRQKLDIELTQVHGQAFMDARQFEAESKAKKDKEDVSKSLSRVKNSVYTNPALASQMIEETNKLIDATRIDATTKEMWKNKELQDIRQNEVRGWISINPVRAKAMLEEGTWNKDISDDLRNSLLHESNQGVRALEIENNRSKRLKDDLLDAEREKRKDDYIGKLAGGGLSAHDIVKDDTLTSADKEHFLRELKNNSLNMTNRTDPNLYNSVFTKIVDGKISSDAEIMKYLGNGLTASDVKGLRRELNSGDSGAGSVEKQLKKGMDDIAKGYLTKSNGMGFKDPEGDTQLQKWRVYFGEKYNEGKANGLTPSQMLNPDSKDYLGNHLKTFVRTPEQVMQSVLKRAPVGTNSPAEKVKVEVAPKKEGESPADYLKRLKAGTN